MSTSKRNSKVLVRVGWGFTALAAFALVSSASLKIIREANNVEYIIGKFGYPAEFLVAIGVVELVCTLLYVWPRTSALGAVLLTAYLGGAVATHVRISESPATPIILASIMWLGLYLRDARLRDLLPLRKPYD